MSANDFMAEINSKIKNKTLPTDRDKESLLNKLNKQLNEEDHIYIFTEILQNMEKKIYTITCNCTLFDLNDLDNENFWKIYYYTQLFIDQHERQKEINKAKQENDDISDQFTRDVDSKLKQIKEQHPEKVDSKGLSEYEKLRINALSQCSYSSYSKEIEATNKNMRSLSRYVGVEKTVYSDNFQQKWKQLNKNDEINKKLSRVSMKCEDSQVCKKRFTEESIEAVGDDDCNGGDDGNGGDNSDDNDNDDDDVMINDDGSEMTDDLKRIIPQMSKVKISLKTKFN